MPKRKRSYSRKRKSTFKRRRFYKRKPARLVRFKNPFGQVRKVRTRYFEKNFDINPSAGGLATTHVFSANGLYDPNISGVGHQPCGFDQYMTMYHKYLVIGAKMTFKFQSRDTSEPQVVCLSVHNTSTANTDVGNLIENGNCKFKLISNVTAGRLANWNTLTYNVNPAKFLGIKNPRDEEDLKGTTAANPTKQVYFHCTCGPDGAGDEDGVSATVIIDYIVILMEPKTLTES